MLDQDQLTKLVQGLSKPVLYPIVATATFTGARLREILALRWSDLDVEKKALRNRAGHRGDQGRGRTIKPPKTKRGLRTIEIDDGLLALLLKEREAYKRLLAGVPTGATVDLSLIQLPAGALMFPNSEGELNLTRLRDARAVSRGFCSLSRRRGFANLRFHDLRASHETILLGKGVPVHVVAVRGGQDPAILLRSYAKRTRKADKSAATVIGTISKGALG